MTQLPISPTHSSEPRTSARNVRPSVSRRKRKSADCMEVVYVPLPPDVDPAFAFTVRTISQPEPTYTNVGIRLKDCTEMNADGVRAVEHADVKVDYMEMFPVGNVVVQRGYFPGENTPPARDVDVKTTLGFTWGRLLSLIVREHLRASVDEAPVAAGGESWEHSMLPHKHIWVVAIRRSNGEDGVVRYFPELEVRIPFK